MTTDYDAKAQEIELPGSWDRESPCWCAIPVEGWVGHLTICTAHTAIAVALRAAYAEGVSAGRAQGEDFRKAAEAWVAAEDATTLRKYRGQP